MKCISAFLSLCLIAAFVVAQPNYDFSKLKREHLGRGVIAIRENPSTVAVSWRYLSSDPMDESFDVYRNGEKVNKYPIRNATFFQDIYKGTESVLYTVKAIQSKTESNYQLPSDAPAGYLNIPLNRPENGTTPAGQSYFYAPNDASIGDVDGDGEYEIILKWDPSNAHDNSHDGYTGEVYFDCYKLNGQHLWRINLGRNIRAGAHYTQFMVFDFDGDGKAEVVMKTADGTVDGKGKVIGDAQADYRNEQGRILTGPEYLTVFNGLTGEAMQTIDYVPGRGNLMDWGDNRGNRSDRFLACVAYLDGIHPSVVICRGYYTRTVLAAYDWNGKELKERWIFDSNHPGCEDYAGQGNHNLRVGDVDGDGCDEIIYGSCAIDHNGKGLYSTKLGHGDAMHLGKFDPTQEGYQVVVCHEEPKEYGNIGTEFRDARTGRILHYIPGNGKDVGRCMVADVDPDSPGCEYWSSEPDGVMYSCKGNELTGKRAPIAKGGDTSYNMTIWWSGSLNRQMLDYLVIHSYTDGRLFNGSDWGVKTASGTKNNACFYGDIWGDWREEVIFVDENDTELRIFTTDFETDYRFHPLMDDHLYRLSATHQNIGYNQPTHPGYYIGSDLNK